LVVRITLVYQSSKALERVIGVGRCTPGNTLIVPIIRRRALNLAPIRLKTGNGSSTAPAFNTGRGLNRLSPDR
jgi:hypothetical protein